MHLKYGHITNVNKDNHVVVQLDGMDNMTTDYIPFVVPNPCIKVNPVTLNALVAVLIDDSGQEGVCLGYVNSQTTSNGELNIDGDLKVSQDVSDSKGSMQSMRTTYDSHTHQNDGKGKPNSKMSQGK